LFCVVVQTKTTAILEIRMKIVSNPIVYFYYKSKEFVSENWRTVLIFAAVVLLAVVGIFAMIWHNRWKEFKAYDDFVVLEKYRTAPITKDAQELMKKKIDEKKFGSFEEKWNQVKETAERFSKSAARTSLSFHFSSVQSEAAVYLDNFGLALEKSEEAMNKSRVDEMRKLFQVRTSALKLDSKDSVVVNEGISELKKVATDDQNPFADFALYILGEYFWHIQKFDEVKNYWGLLKIKYGKSTEHKSSYWKSAEKRYKTIK